jgi:PRD1 phage membrane DNA delivery
MSDKLITGTVSVLLAIVGVAIIALIVSNQANTSSVIGAGGSAFSGSLGCALSPVTGSSCSSGSAALIPNVTSSLSFPS